MMAFLKKSNDELKCVSLYFMIQAEYKHYSKALEKYKELKLFVSVKRDANERGACICEGKHSISNTQ